MTKGQKVLIGTGVLAALLAVLFLFSFTRVPTGYTGIVTTFGKVEDYTLEAGAHFKSPFQKVVRMNNQEMRKDFEVLAFSADIQEVRVAGSVNFNIDKQTAMRLYREVGVNYADVLITPRLLENVKGVFTKFKADGLIQNRTNLSDQVKTLLEGDIEGYGINIISIAIHDVDFSDAYTNAVESKQVAEQTKLRAAIEQDQMTNEANQNATREIIRAKTDLEKARLTTDAAAYEITTKAEAEAAANLKLAEAEATANVKLAQSITAELTQYLEVQRWNGERVMEIHGATPLISLPTE